jgi:glycine/D-amino acid oxidase-like deaminating enzyme
MKNSSADIVICGAGIAGVSAAYFLAVRRGIKKILLVDEHPPLTLTSDKSTECYRNWWPGPGDAMVQLMNHSIDLMEEMAHECGNLFHLNRRGYLYVSSDSDRISTMEESAAEASALGAGELRQHRLGSQSYVPHSAEGFTDSPLGADFITEPALIQEHFPYLAKEVVAALHVRRAGWLSAQQYGMWMLERAKDTGVEIIPGKVLAIENEGGRISRISLQDGSEIQCSVFINAAGPHLGEIGRMMGIDIPVFNELHLKTAFNDHLAVLDRDAPLVIHADPQRISWSDEERAILAEERETAWLLDELAFGAHTRPEGDPKAQSILVLWDLHNDQVEARFPISPDPMISELALRGLSSIIPGMTAYVDKMPRPFVDGGYYTKTEENRPLAGPLPIEGAYVIGAASGYGIMAAAGLAELLSAHIAGDSMPNYAASFSLARYQDAAYQTILENWGDSWQL